MPFREEKEAENITSVGERQQRKPQLTRFNSKSMVEIKAVIFIWIFFCGKLQAEKTQMKTSRELVWMISNRTKCYGVGR